MSVLCFDPAVLAENERVLARRIAVLGKAALANTVAAYQGDRRRTIRVDDARVEDAADLVHPGGV